MDEPPQQRPAGPPAVRPQGPLPAVPPPAFPPPGPAPDRPSTRTSWKRLTRTRRGAAGVAIVAAALLLWPFAGWSWIPWAAGAGAVVLLALLRLDRLLQGWVWHVGGLVVVGGLMYSTGPAAWALAASIGVLVAGLVQLPAWRLAALGAALCVASGVAFGISSYRAAEVARIENERAGEPLRQVVGEARATVILPAFLQAIEDDDADPICRLLSAPAVTELLAAVPAPDCASAVSELHARSARLQGHDEPVPDPQVTESGLVVDACRTTWGLTAGEVVGRIEISRTASDVERYSVSGLAAC